VTGRPFARSLGVAVTARDLVVEIRRGAGKDTATYCTRDYSAGDAPRDKSINCDKLRR
jgi:hypothetical protein